SLKPRTHESYRSNHRALVEVMGGVALAEINRRLIAEHITRRKAGGVTDATIRRDLAFLSAVLSAAVRWDWIEANPGTAISKRSLKEARPRTRFLTRAQFKRLKSEVPDYMKDILVIAVETGMRREELLGL